MKKALIFLLKAGLVGACVVYLVAVVDFGQLLEAFKRFHPAKISLLVAWFTFAYVMLGVRLRFLCNRGIDVRTGFEASVLGMFVNTILPARIGEAAKAWYMHTRSDMSLARCFGAVFWERFADLNIFLLLLLIALFVVGVEAAVLPMALVVGGIWFGLWLIHHRPGVVQWLITKLPGERFKLFTREFVTHLEKKVGVVFGLRLSWFTVWVWMQYVGETVLAILWVAHLDVTVSQALVVFVLASTGIAIPTSPGGIGVFEAIFVFSLGLFGVAREEALATALIVRGVQLLPTFALGGLIMVRSQLKLSQIGRKL